ncbi:ArsR/SmtB family transcription factor [Umezawaea beigongshangensis]|uniref:ArsR/SmtB family transcription factor n=1 Tax=Umezawaea beigongshangensis TaxID=2780383 RepID=UPI0018F1A7C6|nr:helix-turn-helix domain-containing protein [Umezawaea beigongshangensis]
MLRIHFTHEDLVRTTVAGAPDPLWEVVLSVIRLRERDRPPGYLPWVRAVRDGVRGSAGARLLSALAPRARYFPDFLTPHEAADGLAAGLEAVAGTPSRRLVAELRRLDALAPLPRFVAPLVRGERGALARLVDALREHDELAIAPCRDLVAQSVAADRARRARDLLSGGVPGLLDGLRPRARWTPPVLEVDYCEDRDLHLAGRGVVLVPSYFCRGNPVTLADPRRKPVLVYPICDEDRWSRLTPGDHRPLQALIGPTRTATLLAVRAPGTTTELARRVGTSPASISRHTCVLRDAGLIRSARCGGSVVHSLTRLGLTLLDRIS